MRNNSPSNHRVAQGSKRRSRRDAWLSLVITALASGAPPRPGPRLPPTLSTHDQEPGLPTHPTAVAALPNRRRRPDQPLKRGYGVDRSRLKGDRGRLVTDALLHVSPEQNANLHDHGERVSQLAGTLAAALGQPEHEIQRVRLAATLHDVGKTAVPASILDKPGSLDEHEWEFMRLHPLIGERIVLSDPALANTAALIRSSHERIDGQGYPDGLTGHSIPLGSRIIAVCDAFDAMTRDRAYRPAIGVDSALEELQHHAGTQFDTVIVAAFCKQIALRAA